MAATKPPAGGGSFLTRKMGPFPMWVWIGLGVAGVYWYMSRQSSSSASAQQAQALQTQTALANQGAAAMQYGYSAPDLASMLSNLQAQVSALGGGNAGTTATGATSPGSTGNPATTPTPATSAGQVQHGAGYYIPGSTVPIVGQGGHAYEWIPTWSAFTALPKGTATYYEPAPGVFERAPSTGIKGTPLFLQVS